MRTISFANGHKWIYHACLAACLRAAGRQTGITRMNPRIRTELSTIMHKWFHKWWNTDDTVTMDEHWFFCGWSLSTDYTDLHRFTHLPASGRNGFTNNTNDGMLTTRKQWMINEYLCVFVFWFVKICGSFLIRLHRAAMIIHMVKIVKLLYGWRR